MNHGAKVYRVRIARRAAEQNRPQSNSLLDGKSDWEAVGQPTSLSFSSSLPGSVGCRFNGFLAVYGASAFFACFPFLGLPLALGDASLQSVRA